MKTLFFFLYATAASANTLFLDNSTTLLDGSSLTAGTAYKAVFQLNSGGPLSATAGYLASFGFGGGTGFTPALYDFASGVLAIGPNPLAPLGIWQANGTLSLAVNSSNLAALYSQDFEAGTVLSFDFNFSTNLLPGETPAAFAFQLYDPTVSTLLHESAFDITASTANPTPEPALALPAALALAVFADRRQRRS